MKVLILTPLFPPDVGNPAAYVKELATRMTGHEVSLLIYGRLPETVPGITITSIDKRRSLLRRLFSYTVTLAKMSRDADFIIVNNAPSTELPALIVSLVQSKKIILCESDPLALAAAGTGLYKIIHALLKQRCVKTTTLPDETSYKKPEVLPFVVVNEKVLASREVWWENHLKEFIV